MISQARTYTYRLSISAAVACAAWVFFSAVLRADNIYPITWEWYEAPDAVEIRERWPWVRLGPERVDISLSLSGGHVWQSLALGVPSQIGNNTWYFDLPDDPAYFSSNALVRVSSRPAYRRIYQEQIVPISIHGIHFIDPPSTVTNETSVTLSWVATGAGSLVQLGTRVIGSQRYVPQAVFASVDSNQGGITNTATWVVSNLVTMPSEIILQSLADPINYRRHPLEVH